MWGKAKREQQAQQEWSSLTPTQQTYMRELLAEHEVTQRIPEGSVARVSYVLINGAFSAKFLKALAEVGLYERLDDLYAQTDRDHRKWGTVDDLRKWGVIQELEGLSQRDLITMQIGYGDLVYVWFTRAGKAAARAGCPNPNEET